MMDILPINISIISIISSELLLYSREFLKQLNNINFFNYNVVSVKAELQKFDFHNVYPYIVKRT